MTDSTSIIPTYTPIILSLCNFTDKFTLRLSVNGWPFLENQRKFINFISIMQSEQAFFIVFFVFC